MTEPLAASALAAVSIAFYVFLARIIDRNFDGRAPLAGGSFFAFLALHTIAFVTSGTLFVSSFFSIVRV